MKINNEVIYEKSTTKRRGVAYPPCDVPETRGLADKFLRKTDCGLPEVSELEVVRHYTNLSRLNFSVDTHFYPLGSCTMKYNPKFMEEAASIPEFRNLHPLSTHLPGGLELAQGSLEVIAHLEELLCEITGMDGFTCQPMAGAHGEYLGIRLIDAYHKAQGNKKKTVLVPDSSHGTNPASAVMAGYKVITIPSLPNGELDIEAMKEHLNEETAAIMLTCPNTLGLFETRIKDIAELAHSVDALLYYDGANLNAILGKVRPGDIGFDVVHVNVHKTFATPHGTGGPGAGPVGVTARLLPYLPVPRIVKVGDFYEIETKADDSVGMIGPFFGNFSVLLKAYAYIIKMGREGLIAVSEGAVLGANYIMHRLKEYYTLPHDRTCMHECVFSLAKQAHKGVRALDIAKFLIDRDIHPPTVYFPLNVKEALMIEPTETEDKETLDEFIDVMIEAAEAVENNPEVFSRAPENTKIHRPDETLAARHVNVKWEPLTGG